MMIIASSTSISIVEHIHQMELDRILIPSILSFQPWRVAVPIHLIQWFSRWCQDWIFSPIV